VPGRHVDTIQIGMELLRAEWRQFNVSLADVLAEREDAIVVAGDAFSTPDEALAAL
jgi:DNA repair exonuclease SbcCD nuclease subunit